MKGEAISGDHQVRAGGGGGCCPVAGGGGATVPAGCGASA